MALPTFADERVILYGDGDTRLFANLSFLNFKSCWPSKRFSRRMQFLNYFMFAKYSGKLYIWEILLNTRNLEVSLLVIVICSILMQKRHLHIIVKHSLFASNDLTGIYSLLNADLVDVRRQKWTIWVIMNKWRIILHCHPIRSYFFALKCDILSLFYRLASCSRSTIKLHQGKKKWN